MFAEIKYDTELRNELSELKHEMAGVSMVDEFSKYAKLQRKYNKVGSLLKNNSKLCIFSLLS